MRPQTLDADEDLTSLATIRILAFTTEASLNSQWFGFELQAVDSLES